MPVQPTYPGVYIEEIPSGVRTIAGVATSITAFIGYTARGLDNRATRILSFGDFEREFGGLAVASVLSYAVQQFFANGGSHAYVVRVPTSDSVAASITLWDGDQAAGGKKALTITALSKGAWANNVIVDVDDNNIPSSEPNAFNLTITDLSTGTIETFTNVSMDGAKSNFVVAIVNDEDNGSSLVSVKVTDPTIGAGRPMLTGLVGGDIGTISNDKDKKIKISSDAPSGAIQDVEFTFIAPGETIPASIAGVCRLLENKANLALQQALSGARIRCAPSGSGNGIRVAAYFLPAQIPGALDAKITFSAGTVSSSSDDADAFLKLSGGRSNVAHYWLGQGTAKLAQSDAVAGADGTVLPRTADLIGSVSAFTGIYALEKIDLFNILCIADATRALASDPKKLDADNVEPNSIFSAAMTYCKSRRAFLLIDPPPEVADVSSAVDWIS